MCLDKKVRDLLGVEKEGFGFKFFKMSKDGHISFPYFGGRAKVDTWLVSKRKISNFEGYRETGVYETGFHIYVKESSAIGRTTNEGNRVVRRVEYKNARILGKQDGEACIIADSMRILPLGE